MRAKTQAHALSTLSPSAARARHTPSIHRITPHHVWPYLPILGTRVASPPSALFRARSPAHRRHSLVLILGTTPSPFPARHPSLTTAPTTPSSLTPAPTRTTLAPTHPRACGPCVHAGGHRHDAPLEGVHCPPRSQPPGRVAYLPGAAGAYPGDRPAPTHLGGGGRPGAAGIPA